MISRFFMFISPFLLVLQKCYSTDNTNSTAEKKDAIKDSQLGAGAAGPGNLVYTGTANRMVTVAKFFSLSTSALGLCIMPWLYAEMSDGGIIFKVAMMGASSFFIFLTPVLIHTLSKRYVLSMYHDKPTNTFSTVRYNLIMQQKAFSFTPDQIEDTLSSPLCNFQVGNQGFILDTDELMRTDPDAYIAFMRYDEPIDLDKYTVVSKASTDQMDKDNLTTGVNRAKGGNKHG